MSIKGFNISGTTYKVDYPELDNLPQINGNDLVGDLNAEDLGLDQVYWAGYRMTTNAEIEAALNAGKIVLCRVPNPLALLDPPVVCQLTQRNSATNHRFSAITSGAKILLYIAYCINSSWTSGVFELATNASVPAPNPNPATPLGEASAGTSNTYSRGDHVHAMPSAEDVGAIRDPDTKSSGQVLTYNGYSWVARTPSGGGGGGGAVDSVNGQTGDVVLGASDVGAIAAPTSASAGQFLVYDGSAWVAGSGAGLSQEAKSALMDCFAHVAWADANGQTYYNALAVALGLRVLTSISSVYTQSGTVYDTDTLDSLKADLVVTANYAGGTSETVPANDYTLSGTLTEGTSTITVSYAGLTTTFSVTVAHKEEILHQLAARDITISSTNSIAVQDVDRITHTTGMNSQSAYIKSDGTATTTVTPIVQCFGLNTGDSYVLRIKNIEFSNNNAAENYFAVAFKNDSTTTKISSGNIAISQTGSGTVNDVEVTGTMSEDVANVTLFSFVYRASTISYDVELYVNGLRYV
jgi:hypothetical protein